MVTCQLLQTQMEKKNTTLILHLIKALVRCFSKKTNFLFEITTQAKPNKATEVENSCSVTWKNELFIFGGFRERQQISKLEGCSIRKIGDLGFNHVSAACASVSDNIIYLCFNYQNRDSQKLCFFYF